ncbi:hypothetical protein OG429_13430 [Streptomyces sp. NBC_00190]|uniref:hypothetical protein n=1 Tax=Streptomyces sp. NBC_00190 TaxID=2903634 RepID=UPI002E2B1014|nr:hypothetical protein [Streptomyces sp. NBC_00190]
MVARSICLLLAATVRDLLTDCDHDAAFDATGLELVLNRTTEVATATGFYWTSGGQYAEFTGTWDIFHLRNWSSGLTSHNRETWAQLCEVLGEDDEYARYRLDLTRAAAL